ncbi:MAG: hypothetical protein AAF253_01390 [Pseudomonadota bacterium]
MLTAGDEYPIHQTPEPVAFSGSDRNFYDRYFFNGYNADGSFFFAAAFGVYPHLNVMDGAVSILRDGVQTSVHVSRPLGMERMDTRVGGLAIGVRQPLQSISLTLEETEGLALELVFEGRAFPVQEPRFTYRQGPRMLIDCTRMTQNGRWSGSLRIDGETIPVDPGTWRGTRDRSWGVRPIGAQDPQPLTPVQMPQFYWIWTPLNLGDRSVYFHVNDDAAGDSWNTRAKIVPDGSGQGEDQEMAACRAHVTYQPATRRAERASLTFTDKEGRGLGVDITPRRTFLMKGIGYGHSTHRHGAYQGEQLSVFREVLKPEEADWQQPDNLHIQAISDVALTDEAGTRHEGVGTLEQLFLGPHAPSGWTDVLDA